MPWIGWGSTTMAHSDVAVDVVQRLSVSTALLSRCRDYLTDVVRRPLLEDPRGYALYEALCAWLGAGDNA